MRCITAIWPAGPPKLSAATRIHVQKASRMLTPCAGTYVTSRGTAVSFISCLWFGAGPVVGLLAGVATPAIESIVKSHGRIELRKVVPIHARIAERCGEQPFRLRREVGTGGVGTAHDLGKLQEGCGLEPELLD